MDYANEANSRAFILDIPLGVLEGRCGGMAGMNYISIAAIVVWTVSMFVGLWMRAQRRDELTLGDFFWALFFGPIFMLSGFDSWDVPIWKRRSK